MLKKAASSILASLSRSGRLSILSVRMDVALLTRRTVRLLTRTVKWMAQLCTDCGRAREKHAARRVSGRTGEITAFSTILFCGVCAIPGLHAADKIDGQLFVRDVLALPGQPARIEAVLTRKALIGTQQGFGGEQLELVVEGKPVAKAMTGGDGRAFLDYTPKVRGNHEIIVRLTANPRVTSPDAKAVLGAWERRRPILLVEVAAVAQPEKASPLPVPSIPIPLGGQEELLPAPDAAEELNRLAQFFYNVIYVAWAPKGAADPFSGRRTDIREWLARYKFPPGLAMAVAHGEQALGAKIDQLRADGWTNVKSGIGRNRAFADVLTAHRMEVVVVPEPENGELPKKAKAVKEWKEIRKKL